MFKLLLEEKRGHNVILYKDLKREIVKVQMLPKRQQHFKAGANTQLQFCLSFPFSCRKVPLPFVGCCLILTGRGMSHLMSHQGGFPQVRTRRFLTCLRNAWESVPNHVNLRDSLDILEVSFEGVRLPPNPSSVSPEPWLMSRS